MLLLDSRAIHLMAIEDAMQGSGGGGGGGAVTVATPAALIGSNAPTQRFDISVLANLKPSDKYLGKNRVSDIREAYQTYITGSPVGRGGRYAVDAARRYGTTITEAARGYLVGVGLPALADVLPDTGGGAGGGNTTTTTTTTKTPVELLLDALPAIFGQAQYNPPLQTQAYGYTPVSAGVTASGGGGNLSLWLLIGGAAIVGYFIYKRYSG